jgi:hypothetical protein
MLKWDLIRKSEFGIDEFLKNYMISQKTTQNDT